MKRVFILDVNRSENSHGRKLAERVSRCVWNFSSTTIVTRCAPWAETDRQVPSSALTKGINPHMVKCS